MLCKSSLVFCSIMASDNIFGLRKFDTFEENYLFILLGEPHHYSFLSRHIPNSSYNVFLVFINTYFPLLLSIETSLFKSLILDFCFYEKIVSFL